MSLDLARVATQVAAMVAKLKDGRSERQEHLQHALNVLSEKTADVERLKARIASSRTSWLIADLVERPDRRYPAPPTPPEFTVIGVDGSQIEVDRHRSARCFLINLGSVVLRYGPSASASLDSEPHLYSEDSDLVISSGNGRDQAIEGPLLALKRSVEEARQLAEIGKGLETGSVNLGLLDGSLILWGFESEHYPDFVTEALLTKGFLTNLEEMRKLNADRRLAVGSYISLPRSADVVNVLRVAICPHEMVNCERYCPEKGECEAVGGVQDQELFSELLAPGDRSAVFISRSQIQKRYGPHRVYFFYLKVGEEVGRIEVPEWVAANEGLLNITHSLVLDQCQRGQGYPVALSEAHEQAVVTGTDRESFWELVESLSVAEHLPSYTSAKSASKRTRWV